MPDSKQRILDVIKREAFDPVLDADPDDYSQDERKTLTEVQGKTRSTLKRYEDENSAEGVYEAYSGDLSSEAGKRTSDDLRSLHLPTLSSIKEDVDQVAQEVGVK